MKAFKLLLLSFLFLGFTSSTFAQRFTALGFQTGINYGESVINETFKSNGTDFKYATDEADVAVNWGIFMRFEVRKIVFQPQILASNYNTKMRLTSPEWDSILTLKQNRFDIPLLLGWAPNKHMRGLIGPVYTRLLENKVASDEFLFNEFGSVFKGGTWALQLGFGFDMGRLNIDCKYETSLGNITDSITIRGNSFNFDQRKNSVQVTLGYDFIK